MMSDLENSCRICRAKNLNGKFELFVCDTGEVIEKTALGNLYEELFQLQIEHQTAGEPRYVCDICRRKMESFQNFKFQVLKTIEDLEKEKLSYNQGRPHLALLSKLENRRDWEEVDTGQEKSLLCFESECEESTSGIESHKSSNCELDISLHEYAEETDQQPLSRDDGSNDLLGEFISTEDASIEVLTDRVTESEMPAKRKKRRYTRTQVTVTSRKFKLPRQTKLPDKWVCEQCSKTFRSEDQMESHKRTHLGLPPYFCSPCKKGFNQKVHYEHHLKRHNKQFDFSCHVCAKNYVRKSDYICHVRTCHLGEKKFECDICNKKYSRSHLLEVHRFKHFSDDKPFECKDCLQKFASPSALRLHNRSLHLQELRFQCEICSVEFKRKHHLTAHSKTHQKCTYPDENEEAKAKNPQDYVIEFGMETVETEDGKQNPIGNFDEFDSIIEEISEENDAEVVGSVQEEDFLDGIDGDNSITWIYKDGDEIDYSDCVIEEDEGDSGNGESGEATYKTDLLCS